MSSIYALVPLYRELNDLKRIRVADRDGSMAQRLFVRAWKRLMAGESVEAVAWSETAHVVAAARLAGIDAHVLQSGGLDETPRLEILRAGFDAVANALPSSFAEQLRAHLSPGAVVDNGADVDDNAPTVLPEFVALLARQPRAGATRPGAHRIVLEPAENHAEHCAIVAVNCVLASSLTGANVGSAFLTGLCHHLHNAYLPDAGDAGDALLGEHLKPLMQVFRERSLAQLPGELQSAARDSLDAVFRSDTPQAQAFQIADSLDRVLEMEWHARSAEFTLSVALDEMDIIHPSPVQAWQLEVMRQAGFK